MKSKFKIEKGIEAPKPYGGNYPFKDMSVGESFLVPDGKTSRIKIVGATQYYGRKHGVKFTVRTANNKDIRVWRIK